MKNGAARGVFNPWRSIPPRAVLDSDVETLPQIPLYGFLRMNAISPKPAITRANVAGAETECVCPSPVPPPDLLPLLPEPPPPLLPSVPLPVPSFAPPPLLTFKALVEFPVPPEEEAAVPSPPDPPLPPPHAGRIPISAANTQ